jgi:membrane protein DedA with SNARE-associated domain/rhodanese-related sulfurtransferase
MKYPAVATAAEAVSYYLVHITYPVLFLCVLARQLCLPIPAILFLLSSGALAGSGRLSYAGILAVAVLGCVMADAVWYEAGRIYGKRVLRLLCALAPDPSYCIRRARTIFAHKGLRLLLIAKFVPGLDGLCPPLAGLSGASRSSFLAHDAAGATLWASAYITFGFVFAKQVDRVGKYTSALSNAVIWILGVPLFILCVWKLFILLRMIRALRSKEITVDALRARMSSGDKLGIIDLLRFEEDPQGVPGIPGAVRLDPLDLRRRRSVAMPAEVDLILYCRSRDSFVSARVAAAMRKHGVRQIRVLVGGLAAWQSLGLPLTTEFADPEREFVRLGIEVNPPWSQLKRQN